MLTTNIRATKELTKLLKTLLSVLSCGLCMLGMMPSLAVANANFEIIYGDSANEGFFDPTEVAPVGNNEGATLGEQRRNALEFSLSMISKAISSEVPITILAQFDNLGGNSASASLAFAGPRSLHWNFNNAPESNMLYPAPLANKLAGTDLSPNDADIDAVFNSDIDGNTVLGSSTWYYGLDQQGSSQDTDFVSVAIHELLHGLGFLSMVDVNTGSFWRCSGDPTCENGLQDIFSSFIERSGSSPADFVALVDSQREALISTPSTLQWKGEIAQQVSELKGLNFGAPQGKPLLYTPRSVSSGSSLSHFDDTISPDVLLEPFYIGDSYNFALGAAVLADMGWGNQISDLSFSFSQTSSNQNIHNLSLIVENLGPGAAADYTITISLEGDGTFRSGTMASNGACTTTDRVVRCIQNTTNAGDMDSIDLSITSEFQVTISTSLETTQHIEVNESNHEIEGTINEGVLDTSESPISPGNTGNTPQVGNIPDISASSGGGGSISVSMIGVLALLMLRGRRPEAWAVKNIRQRM